VNTHLGYNRTPYGRHDLVEQKLTALGVRYVRDGLAPGRPDIYRALRRLEAGGIRANLIAGDPLERWGTGPLEEQLAVVKQELRGAVVSLEGPNEYDNQGGEGWLPVLSDYQRRLYHGVKSDPALAHLSVLGPSLVHRESQQQLGDISAWLDYGNLHPYPGGQAPDRDSHMGDQLARGALNAGSKAIQATETGYHNALATESGHRPTSEQVAGIYMPRLYLDYYRRGIARTFAYELIDVWPDSSGAEIFDHFGLLRNDMSEKPAYAALERLIGLLEDRGPSFAPESLDYRLEDAPPTLRRLLFQKRDGSFYLALWNAVSVWDADQKLDLWPGEDTLRLELAEPAGVVEAYRPSESDRPLLRRANAASVSLPSSPSVTIVRIAETRADAAPETRADAAPRRSHVRPPRRRAPLYAPLRGKERRVARALLRLRAAKVSTRSRPGRRIRRLEHWLGRRARLIRGLARRTGWHRSRRRLRHRAILRVLRAR
jgi:hypothetical protein